MAGKLTDSRRGITLVAAAGYIAAGAVASAIMWMIFPDGFLDYALMLGGIFTVAGVILTLVLGIPAIESDPAKISGAYLASRAVKMLLTIGGLLLCVFFTGLDRKILMVGVLTFYLIYMLVDLYVFMLFTKKAGRKNAV